MNTTGTLPTQRPATVAGSAGATTPGKAIAAPTPTKLGLGLLVALVVGSIIGSGICPRAVGRVRRLQFRLGLLGQRLDRQRWLPGGGVRCAGLFLPGVRHRQFTCWAPTGRKRWTLAELEAAARREPGLDRLSRETVRRMLKKTISSPGSG